MAKKKVDPGLATAATPPAILDYVIVELRYDSGVAPSGARFAGPGEADTAVEELNEALGAFDIRSFGSHFGMKAAEVRRRATVAANVMTRSVSAEFAQAGFVKVIPRNARDAERLAGQLDRLGSVWKAVVAPRPVPAVMATGSSRASRNFEPAQGYLASAPDGIGAMAVWPQRGGKGQRVTICDIEGNWNRSHEDLPRGIRLIGGTVIPDVGWRNHGTAVLGEMVSRPKNDYGCVGISHGARAVVQSAVVGGVFNTAAALTNATKKLKAGDAILIELQATGPNGKYVAMQYWDDIFSAIRVATKKGITVVEAAGNGNENFGLAVFNNTGLQKDSGAIVVGAGVPPMNYFDQFGGGGRPGYSKIGVPRSRIWFSNYGKIVSVQGWGWHVTTLGYGDAQGGAQKRWYTLRFSGTSSASPIVTGAVACIQGRAIAKRGGPLTPARVRTILKSTGTPQQSGPGVPLGQRIGPLPNLQRAFRRI